MPSKSLFTLICVLLLGVTGCESGTELVNSDQPKDLGTPWVNKTASEFGFSGSSSDASNNRVFSCTTTDLHSLLESIAAEYMTAIVVKPKKMLDWNLTVEVKGKNLDEVLKDVAAKCRLSLGQSSGGLPMLTFPGDSSSDEFVVKFSEEGGGSSDE